jgi:hypothetical protein
VAGGGASGMDAAPGTSQAAMARQVVPAIKV